MLLCDGIRVIGTRGEDGLCHAVPHAGEWDCPSDVSVDCVRWTCVSQEWPIGLLARTLAHLHETVLESLKSVLALTDALKSPPCVCSCKHSLGKLISRQHTRYPRSFGVKQKIQSVAIRYEFPQEGIRVVVPSGLHNALRLRHAVSHIRTFPYERILLYSPLLYTMGSSTRTFQPRHFYSFACKYIIRRYAILIRHAKKHEILFTQAEGRVECDFVQASKNGYERGNFTYIEHRSTGNISWVVRMATRNWPRIANMELGTLRHSMTLSYYSSLAMKRRKTRA